MHSEKSSLGLVVVTFTFSIIMPKRLLEQVCLRVDQLKDAAGSPFGKTDRHCLYLHVHVEVVSSGGAPTSAGTSMFTM